MKLSKAILGILIMELFQIILSKTYHTKTKLTRNTKTTKEGPLKRNARRMGVELSKVPGDNPFAPSGVKGDDNDPDDNEKSKYVGRANPKYGKPVILMSGYLPNRYPKCLVENRLAKYKNDDTKNQKSLKKCTIKHVLYSIDFDKPKIKKCLGIFKRNYPHHRAYGYILSSLLKYAKNFDDNVMDSQFKVCGNDFVEELRAKARQYESNFRIAISLFADLDDLFTYPPKPPLGYAFTKKRKLRKIKKLKKIKKRKL